MFKTLIRKWHSIAGLVGGVFFLSLAVTGILLNHYDQWFGRDSALHSAPVHALVIHPLNHKEVLLTNKKGLFRSIDQGHQFEKIELKYPSHDISALDFDQAGRLYLALGEGLVLRSEPIYPYMWERLNLPENVETVFEIKTGWPGDIFLGTDQGLFSSSDDGQSWQVLHQTELSLKSLVYSVHTGLVASPWLVYFHDVAALLLILLVLSGFIIFFRLLRKQ